MQGRAGYKLCSVPCRERMVARMQEGRKKMGKGGVELGSPKKELILSNALHHLTKEMVALSSQKNITGSLEWF